MATEQTIDFDIATLTAKPGDVVVVRVPTPSFAMRKAIYESLSEKFSQFQFMVIPAEWKLCVLTKEEAVSFDAPVQGDD